MKLERIITLANRGVRLRFAAMERSLRASVLPVLRIELTLPDRTYRRHSAAQP